MSSLEELTKEIEAIKERNRRVEADKEWETSWTRKFFVLFLTYIIVVVFFLIAKLPQPFLNALIPTFAFVISTATLPFIKRWWLKYRKHPSL